MVAWVVREHDIQESKSPLDGVGTREKADLMPESVWPAPEDAARVSALDLVHLPACNAKCVLSAYPALVAGNLNLTLTPCGLGWHDPITVRSRSALS